MHVAKVILYKTSFSQEHI